MTEIWKDIKDYEGIYQISNLGRVKRLGWIKKDKLNRRTYYTDCIMKGHIGKDGYKRVVLTNNNSKKKSFLVHRLVGTTFLNNRMNKPEVNHIDGDKLNNNMKNLEWVTAKENTNHAWRKGLINEKWHIAHNQKKIIAIDKKNNVKIYFNSIKVASNKLGTSTITIRKLLKGKRVIKGKCKSKRWDFKYAN